MAKPPGIARDEEVGHVILNHHGRRILISLRAHRYLKKHKYLRWNQQAHGYEFKKWIYCHDGRRVSAYQLYLELEVKCCRPSEVIRELGVELTGPNVVICNCNRCRKIQRLEREEELECGQTGAPALSQVEIDAIKRRRRYQ